MTKLPGVFATVDVPRYLAPSALGAWGGCVLKLVAASTPTEQQLPSGPEAAIGTLVHRVFERWSRGEFDDPAALFDDEYARSIADLEQDPRRRHFAELSTTRSLQQWTRLRASTVDRCRRQLRVVRMNAEAVASTTRRIAGVERLLESERLRLRGRADRIRAVTSSAYEVRDIKTGSVCTADDEIRPEIKLQLRAYGLMVLEAYPQAEVRLVVDDGSEREVTFDVESQAQARRDIELVTDRVPPPGIASARELATPGAACSSCSIRHRCVAYLEAAPHWWRNVPDTFEHLANDIWGQVIERRTSDHAAGHDVVLLDAAGRRVRIDGLDRRHALDQTVEGSTVWLFQLQATGPSRGFDGRRFHPRSFHELPRDRRERRAWSVTCFTETRPT